MVLPRPRPVLRPHRAPGRTGLSGLTGLPRAAWHRVRTDAFGAEPRGERLARVHRSPQFADGAFRNPVPTRRLVYERSPLEITRAQLAADRARRVPTAAVPLHRLLPVDLAEPPASGLRLTWLGHATVLAEIGGRRVLFDPVWGDRCSPSPGPAPNGSTRCRCRSPNSTGWTSWSSPTTTTTTSTWGPSGR